MSNGRYETSTKISPHFRGEVKHDPVTCHLWLDRKGQTVVEGDIVSSPMYPRGTVQGVVESSTRGFCAYCGRFEPLLRTSDGTLYRAGKMLIKRRRGA